MQSDADLRFSNDRDIGELMQLRTVLEKKVACDHSAKKETHSLNLNYVLTSTCD